jgi:hypothetical protein
VKAFGSIIVKCLGENACFPGESFDMVRPATIGLIGSELLNSSSLPVNSVIMPNYIRKSDAEINLKK